MSVDPDELIPSGDTARELKLKEQTLAVWRSQGRGPKFYKVGRSVFYRRSDISAWLGDQVRDPAAKTAA